MSLQTRRLLFVDRWCIAFYRFSFCGSSYVGLMCILKSLSPSKISNLKQAIKHRGWVSEGIIRVLKAKGRGGRQKSKCSYETDVFAENMRGDSGFKSGPVLGVPKSRGTGTARRWPLPPAPGSFWAFPPPTSAAPCLRSWGSLSRQAALARPGRPHRGAVAALKS